MKISYTTGFAGTGKSTDLLKLLRKLNKDTSVCLAPTHKALHRLREEYNGKVELKTIHSLLGLIPTINEKAKHIGHINGIMKLDKDLDKYTDIVIDEAGMLSEEHFFDLIAKLDELEDLHKIDITLHLYLDPYQLLPVKGVQIQVPRHSTDSEKVTNLTTQHRSESLDVVETYTKFVHFLQGTNTDDLQVRYSTNILEFDISEFQEGDRLLAYTNKAVGKWNKDIAKHLGIEGYEGQEVQLGNSGTVIVKSFIKPKYQELLKAYETGTLRLQNNKLSKQYLESSLRALIDNRHIKFIEVESHIIPVVVGIGYAAEAIKGASEAAIKNRSKFVDVYALGRAFIMDYNFASTVHKAQGSEFETVFIDKLDIQKSIYNGYYGTYARLMYVAISRCKKRLYI